MSLKNVLKCKASHECHEKNHLCQIILRKDLGRIKELIGNPGFFCKNCGRAARDKGNLCNPSSL